MYRTTSLPLASILVHRDYRLQSIEGPPGRRVFVFADEIPDEIVMRFLSSPEKKLLDVHRSLKVQVMSV